MLITINTICMCCLNTFTWTTRVDNNKYTVHVLFKDVTWTACVDNNTYTMHVLFKDSYVDYTC